MEFRFFNFPLIILAGKQFKVLICSVKDMTVPCFFLSKHHVLHF